MSDRGQFGDLIANDTMELPVKLTTGEMLEYGREAAKLHARVEDRADEERARRKSWKAEQDTLIDKHSEVNRWVADGAQPRDVPVSIYGDHVSNVRRVVRTDTWEVVSERALDDEERERLLQIDMYGGSKGGTVVEF